ncbi:MAG: hypothetical protein WC402_02795, partial [Candidatus Pacearchaeota archaeon]
GAGIVIATGGTTLTNGHDYTEVGIPTCSDNQVLKWSSGKWNCGTITPTSSSAQKSVDSSQLNGYWSTCGESDACCFAAFSHWCIQQGYLGGTLTYSGGRGWCGPGVHAGVCIK